jgi:zinc/manganese transport system substrate-binding protein
VVTQRPALVAVGSVVAGVLLIGACAGGSPTTGGTGGRVQIVAAENFWGSIAEQIAGNQAEVTSVVTNPATDPHDYEATPQDARRVASADYVIVNGIGYDAWAQKLLDANPSAGRIVLDIGKLVGVKVGGNPHQWYAPGTVAKFVARVARDLARLDPDHAGYFAQRRAAYATRGLAEYTGLIEQIRRDYAGTPIGGSESIVAPLVSALGLSLKTPESYLDAVAEGNEPTAHDTAIVNEQIAQRVIKVFVFNSQNATPDVKRLVDAARAREIAVTTVTETMVPAGVTFQAWQSNQLRKLRDALASGVGSP